MPFSPIQENVNTNDRQVQRAKGMDYEQGRGRLAGVLINRM
jgi:hypothetical protein